jgi:hypothetical protein
MRDLAGDIERGRVAQPEPQIGSEVHIEYSKAFCVDSPTPSPATVIFFYITLDQVLDGS